MPRPRKSAVPDKSLLSAALEGLELQKQRIEEQIQQVRAMLGMGGAAKRGRPRKSAEPAVEAGSKPGRRKRQLSAAARKRIAAAQKKRWAEFRKKEASAKE